MRAPGVPNREGEPECWQRQVFWLTDQPDTAPSRLASAEERWSIQWHAAVTVPDYSGATATEFRIHRSPSSLFICTHGEFCTPPADTFAAWPENGATRHSIQRNLQFSVNRFQFSIAGGVIPKSRMVSSAEKVRPRALKAASPPCRRSTMPTT